MERAELEKKAADYLIEHEIPEPWELADFAESLFPAVRLQELREVQGVHTYYDSSQIEQRLKDRIAKLEAETKP